MMQLEIYSKAVCQCEILSTVASHITVSQCIYHFDGFKLKKSLLSASLTMLCSNMVRKHFVSKEILPYASLPAFLVEVVGYKVDPWV